MKLLLNLLLIGWTASTASAAELIERVYRVDVHQHEVFSVVRESRTRERDGELSGYRQRKVYSDRTLVQQSVEHFGVMKLSDGQAISYIDTPTDVKAIGAQMDAAFTSEIKGRKQGQLIFPTFISCALADASGPPTQTDFIYIVPDGGAGSAADLDLSSRGSANSWRREFDRDQANREAQDSREHQVSDGERRALYQAQRSMEIARGETAELAARSLVMSSSLLRQAFRRQPQLAEAGQHEVSVYLNSNAQDFVRQEIAQAVQDDQWPVVARMVSELESPLLLHAADETKAWLNEDSIPRLLRRPVVLDDFLMPRFGSPEFEHQKILIANLLQTVAIMRPNFLDTKAADWVRVAAYLTEAARFAESRGDEFRAAELLEQASSVAGFLAGDGDGRSLILNGNDPTNYELAFKPGALTTDTYDSAPGEAISQAALNVLGNEI